MAAVSGFMSCCVRVTETGYVVTSEGAERWTENFNSWPVSFLLIISPNLFVLLADQRYHRDQIPVNGELGGVVEWRWVPGCSGWPRWDVCLWNGQLAVRTKPRFWDVSWKVLTGIHTNIQKVSPSYGSSLHDNCSTEAHMGLWSLAVLQLKIPLVLKKDSS